MAEAEIIWGTRPVAAREGPVAAREGTVTELNFANPVFTAYAIAAALMVLKVVAMSWLTVVRMMSENA